MSEEFDKSTPATDIQADDTPDVEGHRHGPPADKVAAATEEGPDVEAHKLPPKTTPA